MAWTTRRKYFGIGGLVLLMLAACAMDARLGPIGGSQKFIVAAESAAARFPRASAGTKAQFLPRWDYGTVERRCVEVTGPRPLRSGEFVAARFGLYQLWGNRPIKLAPAYPNLDSNRLRPSKITATRLNARTQVREFRATASSAGEVWHYPSTLGLPWFGRWMIVVTEGENWGCFIYTASNP
jgi:hypothetical protein